jgi:hypothetical protein
MNIKIGHEVKVVSIYDGSTDLRIGDTVRITAKDGDRVTKCIRVKNSIAFGDKIDMPSCGVVMLSVPVDYTAAWVAGKTIDVNVW